MNLDDFDQCPSPPRESIHWDGLDAWLETWEAS